MIKCYPIAANPDTDHHNNLQLCSKWHITARNLELSSLQNTTNCACFHYLSTPNSNTGTWNLESEASQRFEVDVNKKLQVLI